MFYLAGYGAEILLAFAQSPIPLCRFGTLCVARAQFSFLGIALSPTVSERFDAQMAVLDATHRLVSSLAGNYQMQIGFIAPWRDELYRQVSKTMRDGRIFFASS